MEDKLLKTLLDTFTNEMSSTEKHKKIYPIIESISGLETPLQAYYIATIAKHAGIKEKLFLEALKAEKTKINDTEEKQQNAPSVDLLEKFILKNYDMRNNIISNRFECKAKDANEFEEMNEFNILRHLRKNHFKIKIQELIETLKSDFTPAFNPFQEYFENLDTTDTTDHIEALAGFITLADETEREFFNLMFKKALVRSIACSLGYNFNKQSFILVGEGAKNQNMGKTSFIRFLAPPKLLDYYTEELTLDKDGFIALAENMIINLDELSTLQKAEINQLKTYMSKDIVKVRLPYERRAVTIKRRANFWGSTNEAKFLTDLTGNVRWLAFKIVNINFDYSKKIDINKVWAQAYRLLTENKAGKNYNYQLTVEEIKLNEKRNDNFMSLPAEMELLQKYFTPSNAEQENNYFLQTNDFVKVLSKITEHSNKFNINAVGRALRKLDFEIMQKTFKEKGFQLKGYYVTLNDSTIEGFLSDYKIISDVPY
ncbi:MAG: VapE domain-containing protein [Bacteroidota bacterium]